MMPQVGSPRPRLSTPRASTKKFNFKYFGKPALTLPVNQVSFVTSSTGVMDGRRIAECFVQETTNCPAFERVDAATLRRPAQEGLLSVRHGPLRTGVGRRVPICRVHDAIPRGLHGICTRLRLGSLFPHRRDRAAGQGEEHPQPTRDRLGVCLVELVFLSGRCLRLVTKRYDRHRERICHFRFSGFLIFRNEL